MSNERINIVEGTTPEHWTRAVPGAVAEFAGVGHEVGS